MLWKLAHHPLRGAHVKDSERESVLVDALRVQGKGDCLWYQIISSFPTENQEHKHDETESINGVELMRA